MNNKHYLWVFLGFVLSVILSDQVFAQTVDDVQQNIVDSVTVLPGAVAGLAYLSGLLLCVLAVFKLIEHVGNPNQTPLRTPVIRFLVGGALFALPIITEAAIATINGGTVAVFDPSGQLTSNYGFGAINGIVAGHIGSGNINGILGAIDSSITRVPGFIAAIAYLLGLLLAVSALYKTRDHVDDPDRAPLKDAVIRYVAAGMLFALPTIFNAMFTAIQGSGLGFGGAVANLLQGNQLTNSTETGVNDCATGVPTAGNLGEVMCNTMETTMGIPAMLTAISYVLGLVFGVWAIIKIRDHVNNPSQTALSEGVTRLIAGGAFFSLPVLAMALQHSVTTNTLATNTLNGTNTGFNTPIPLTCTAANGLDEAMACFMADTVGPAHVLLNFFSFSVGFILLMIGISRLIKSTQEGTRGPGGLGTVTTFAVAGIFMSATTILRAFSSTFFNNTDTATTATLTYAAGMSAAEQAAAYNVINAVLQFMIIVGMISFVRGIFIMRDVSEGSQQASAMAGMTHIIGGALAVNLGPLLNAVQNTLGITTFGVTFA